MQRYRTTKRRLRGGIKRENLGWRAEDMDIIPFQARRNDAFAVDEHELINWSDVALALHEWTVMEGVAFGLADGLAALVASGYDTVVAVPRRRWIPQ